MGATWNTVAKRWQGPGGRFIVGPTPAALQQQATAISRVQQAQERLNASLGIYKGIILSIAAIGFITFQADAIKQAAQFEQSMTLLQTQAGATRTEVENMTAAVLRLGPSLQFGPQALAEALFQIESAGFRGANALELLTVAAQGARVGNADLTDTTSALVGILVSGIGGINGATDAMAQLNGVVGAGKIEMQDLVVSLKSGILATARAFGINFQQVGAAIDLLTDSATPAAEASTRLRISIALLGAPTRQAERELARVGLTSRNLADVMRSPAGLIGALRLLRDAMNRAGLDATEQAQLIKNAFGGARSAAGILSLIQNVDRLAGKLDLINKIAGEFPEAIAIQQATAQAKFNRLGAIIEVLAIKLGNALLPMAIGAAEALAVLASNSDLVIAAFTVINILLAIMVARWLVNLVTWLVTSAIQFGLAAKAAFGFAAALGGANATGIAGAAGLAIAALGRLLPIIGLVTAEWDKMRETLIDPKTGEINLTRKLTASEVQHAIYDPSKFYFGPFTFDNPFWGQETANQAKVASDGMDLVSDAYDLLESKHIALKAAAADPLFTGTLSDIEMINELNAALEAAGLPTIDLESMMFDLEAAIETIATHGIPQLVNQLSFAERALDAIDQSVNTLANDLINHLYGDAINAGRRADIKNQIENIQDALRSATNKREALILKGQLAQLRGELFMLNYEAAQMAGHGAALRFLDRWERAAGHVDKETRDLIDSLRELHRRALALDALKIVIDIIKSVTTVGGGGGGGGGEGGDGDRFGPGDPRNRRAQGGPLRAGQLASVGELGPEFILPLQDIYVIPQYMRNAVMQMESLNRLSHLRNQNDYQGSTRTSVIAGSPAMSQHYSVGDEGGGGMSFGDFHFHFHDVGSDVSPEKARKFASDAADEFRRQVKRVPVRTIR
jgi:TP901 family phage tail tape measure protein